MARIEHVETGKILKNDAEIPAAMTYSVESYDEETDELVTEDRIELEGEEYRVLDNGINMV
jgi:hypothetical protein